MNRICLTLIAITATLVFGFSYADDKWTKQCETSCSDKDNHKYIIKEGQVLCSECRKEVLITASTSLVPRVKSSAPSHRRSSFSREKTPPPTISTYSMQPNQDDRKEALTLMTGSIPKDITAPLNTISRNSTEDMYRNWGLTQVGSSSLDKISKIFLSNWKGSGELSIEHRTPSISPAARSLLDVERVSRASHHAILLQDMLEEVDELKTYVKKRDASLKILTEHFLQFEHALSSKDEAIYRERVYQKEKVTSLSTAVDFSDISEKFSSMTFHPQHLELVKSTLQWDTWVKDLPANLSVDSSHEPQFQEVYSEARQLMGTCYNPSNSLVLDIEIAEHGIQSQRADELLGLNTRQQETHSTDNKLEVLLKDLKENAIIRVSIGDIALVIRRISSDYVLYLPLFWSASASNASEMAGIIASLFSAMTSSVEDVAIAEYEHQKQLKENEKNRPRFSPVFLNAPGDDEEICSGDPLLEQFNETFGIHQFQLGALVAGAGISLAMATVKFIRASR